MGIFASPDLFPFDIDVTGGEVRLVHLSQASYEAESFLDERLISGTTADIRMPIQNIVRDEPRGAPKLNYIFHLGHVGSTLLSRILGSGRSVFSIREPLILRRLAAFEFELRASYSPWPPALFNARLDTVLKLLGRVYHPGQTSLIKTTSFVGEMAPLLMARAPSARAIVLVAHPKTFIATLLAGDNSRAELANVSDARLARVRHRCPSFAVTADGMSEGERAALAWVSELLGPAEAGSLDPGRTLWVDFDDFLSEPRRGLEAILAHLDGETNAHDIEVMLASPDFARYAKATERGYDGSVRHGLIREAMIAHHDEIERGLAWINMAATGHREIAAAARAAATAVRKGRGR